MKVIKNVRLYGELTDITVENGKIAAIGKTDADGVDFGGNKIYPGLIDIHCHGCRGFDTMEGHIEEMADWQLANGTTTWYPTTMTMSKEDIIKATKEPIDFGHGANIPGFHLEGPFINPNKKGAMNEAFITDPTMDLINSCDNVKRITLAPERAGSMEFIKKCPAVVSIGHTEADYETASEAFKNGARSLTHTYNVMPGIHHRSPGPIGAGADNPDVFAELICDGVHIHASAVRMLIRIFGYDRVILVSDCIRATGYGDGEYDFGGLKITVTDGKALTMGGNLAGATTPLLGCVKVAKSFGIPEEMAFKMASENPARHMGLNKGKIEVGYDADFVIVDDDLNLVKAIARGEF